jgi:hypothetical protein
MYSFKYDEDGNVVDDYDIPVITSTTTSANKVGVSASPTFWETDIDIDTRTIHSREPVTVITSEMVQEKIAILMQKFVHMEWLAYLVGEKCPDGSYYITDLAIPKQEVTVVNVYVKDSVDVPIVGVIHSHHDMGNNFSHTDDEYINSNHDLSLCVCNNGINGQVRIRKDDGDYEIAPVSVQEYCSFDKEEFLESVDELINERRYNYTNVVRSSSAAIDSISDKFYDSMSVGDSFDTRDVVGLIEDYQFLVKADEVSQDLDLDELFFMYVLINNLHGDSFDTIMGYVYDGTLTISIEAMNLMEELDMYRGEFTHNETVLINRLYNDLSVILTNNDYKPSIDEEIKENDESNQ